MAALGRLAQRAPQQGAVLTSWAVRTLATLCTEADRLPDQLTGTTIAELWRAVRAFVLEQNSRGHLLPLLRLTDSLRDRRGTCRNCRSSSGTASSAGPGTRPLGP